MRTKIPAIKSMKPVPRSGHELTETPGLLRVCEAGSILQMCDAQIYTLAKAGQIPSYKIGRRRLFKLDELNSWIESKRQGAA
jgi:excisionase family DNA binding protein